MNGNRTLLNRYSKTSSSLFRSLLIFAFLIGFISPVHFNVPTSLAQANPPGFNILHDGPNYRAESTIDGTIYTGSLKHVVESAVNDLHGMGGGLVSFEFGVFDLGGDWFEFWDITDVTFEGQGIDITILQNNSSASTDTEVFDCEGCDRLTFRDMTIEAGGTERSTSDAMDFDGGDDILIERVKVDGARGRGIVFDGKDQDTGGSSVRNVIRDCIVTNVPRVGIEFLASSQNRVENCQISDTGRYGIYLNKSSSSASIPNKPPDDNVIINNFVTNAGQDGIAIHSGNRNLITGNTVFNSSDDLPSKDGIRIFSTDSIVCDDNVVEYNIASDNQPVKTQRYGLHIVHTECNRTVVRENDFTGNILGEIRDNGTGTIYETSGDTEAPSVPQNVQAVASAETQVDLSWEASTDNVGVTGYTVYRDGVEVVAVDGSTLNYSDTSVVAGTTFSYTVDAFDAAGNRSAESSPPTVVTTPGTSAGGTFTFHPVADSYVNSASPAQNYGTSSQLRADGSPDVRSYLRFDLQGMGGTVVSATLDIYANSGSSTGFDVRGVADSNWSESLINYSNAPSTGSVAGSSGSFGADSWTNIDVTSLISGNGVVSLALTTAGSTAMSLASREDSGMDPPGTPVKPTLVIVTSGDDDTTPPETTIDSGPPSTTTSTDATFSFSSSEPGSTFECMLDGAGFSACGSPQHYAGLALGQHTFEVRATDVAGNTDPTPASHTWTIEVIDSESPTTPANVQAVAIGETQVDLSWDASTDNVGVTGYTVYRDGVELSTVGGATLNFSDTTVVAGTTYGYTVDAFDAAGNRSSESSPPAVATTPGGSGGITIESVADSYVHSGQPARNYGSSNSLRTDGSPEIRSYLKFNVPSVAGTITSVTMRVQAGSNLNSGIGVTVSLVVDTSWDETTITFASAPVVGIPYQTVATPIGSGEWIEFDLTGLVSGPGLVSVALTSSNTRALRMDSRESGPSSAPQLVITTTAAS